MYLKKKTYNNAIVNIKPLVLTQVYEKNKQEGSDKEHPGIFL